MFILIPSPYAFGFLRPPSLDYESSSTLTFFNQNLLLTIGSLDSRGLIDSPESSELAGKSESVTFSSSEV